MDVKRTLKRLSKLLIATPVIALTIIVLTVLATLESIIDLVKYKGEDLNE